MGEEGRLYSAESCISLGRVLRLGHRAYRTRALAAAAGGIFFFFFQFVSAGVHIYLVY